MRTLLVAQLFYIIIVFSSTPRDVFHVPSIVAIATTAAVLLLNCNSREPLYVLDFQGELKWVSPSSKILSGLKCFNLIRCSSSLQSFWPLNLIKKCWYCFLPQLFSLKRKKWQLLFDFFRASFIQQWTGWDTVQHIYTWFICFCWKTKWQCKYYGEKTIVLCSKA